MLRYTLSFLVALSCCVLTAQTHTVSGQINGIFDDEIGGVTIDLLDANNQLIESQLIDCGGTYTFSGLAAGQNYNLRLDKEGSQFNGISTYDLVLIAKHLIGVETLNHPLKIRAADIDDSGTVSIMDLLRLRAWILAIDIELPENAWLFFQEDAGIAGPVFPLVLMGDQMDYDFTGVKRGDINGSASPCQ